MGFKKSFLFALATFSAVASSSDFVFPGEYAIAFVLNDGRYRFPVVYEFNISNNQQLTGQVNYPSFRCKAGLSATDFVNGSVKPVENMQGQRPICGARAVTLHFGKDDKIPSIQNYLTFVPAPGDNVVVLESYQFTPNVLSAFLLANSLSSPHDVSAAKPSLALSYIRVLGLEDNKARHLLNNLYDIALAEIDITTRWQRELVRDFTGHAKHQNLVAAFFNEYKKVGYEALLSFTDEMGSFLVASEVAAALDAASQGLPHLNSYKADADVVLQEMRYYEIQSHLVFKLLEGNTVRYWRLPVASNLVADVQGFLGDPKLKLDTVLPLLQQDPAAFVQQQYFLQSQQVNSIEQWQRFLTRYPNAVNKPQVNAAIARLQQQAETARLKQAEALAAAAAAREAREQARAERERRIAQAYLAEKYLGQEICRDFRIFFSASEVKGFVEQVAGSRIQIRIHYNGGSSLTNYREQGIYWDEHTNWRACRF